jgi:hypothetical protein
VNAVHHDGERLCAKCTEARKPKRTVSMFFMEQPMLPVVITVARWSLTGWGLGNDASNDGILTIHLARLVLSVRSPGAVRW